MKYIITNISLFFLISVFGCKDVPHGDKTATFEDASISSKDQNKSYLSKGPFAITAYTSTWPKGIIKVDPSINILDSNNFFDPFGCFYPANETIIKSLYFTGILIDPPKIPRIGRSRNRIYKSESPTAFLYLSQQDKKHGYILECLGGSITSDSMKLVFYNKEVGTFFVNGIIITGRDPIFNSERATQRKLNAIISFWQDTNSIFEETIKFDFFKMKRIKE